MRDFKFRIWDKECGCWDREPENKLLSSIVCSMEEDGLTYNLEGSYLQSLRFEKVQFTGLYDCDGKEIWEGDIIEYKSYGRYLVEFDVGAFRTECLEVHGTEAFMFETGLLIEHV